MIVSGKPVVTSTMLSALYKLDKRDIENLIETSAYPYLSITPEFPTWVGYIPYLKEFFNLEIEQYHDKLEENLNKLQIKSTLENTLVKLEFEEQQPIPPASILFGTQWVEHVTKNFNITDTTQLLVSSKNNTPVFCGHKNTIERLSDNLSGDILIIKATKLLEVGKNFFQ